MAKHLEPTRLILVSQACLYCLLLLCAILLPTFLFRRDEGGVSNYGVHELTIIPYSLAFLTGGGSLLYAARILPAATRRRTAFARSMQCIGILLLCVLVSTYPYKLNAALDDIHSATAIALFTAEFLAGLWFTLRFLRNTPAFILFGVQLLGLLLCLLTIIGTLDILFIAQTIAGVAFGLLLVRAVSVAVGESVNHG